MKNRTEIDNVPINARRIKGFFRSFFIVLMVVVLSGGICYAKAVPEFETMKSLVGEWKGTAMNGKTATVTYTLVSDKSALMERLAISGESEMVTLYHPDGDHVMMTHYCSAHNQPRMRAKTAAAGSKSITFDMVDITNLSAPDAGHMVRLVVTLEDKDHLTQEWTWKEKGKEGTEVIRLVRSK